MDTTPDYPEQPENLVETAALDLPAVLQDMPNQTSCGAGDPGHGHRVVSADHLVEALAERKGHRKAAAAWAVHRLLRRGLLRAEVARHFYATVVGHEQVPGRLMFGVQRYREQPICGTSEMPLADPAAGPVPYRHLLVYSTDELWAWWRSPPGGRGEFPPASAAERSRQTMSTEPGTYTLGQLISELEGSEEAYRQNIQTADRVESQDENNLQSTRWRMQAAALSFQPDPARMPGIGRIAALCDAEWGTGLKAENVRKLRGRACGKLGVGTEEADALTLSDLFRYAGGPDNGELWVDLHQFQVVMDRICEAFELLLRE